MTFGDSRLIRPKMPHVKQQQFKEIFLGVASEGKQSCVHDVHFHYQTCGFEPIDRSG